MPLSKVKEKEFLSRPMGCKGIGFSFVRCKPGEGATYVHRHKCRKRYLSRSRETVRCEQRRFRKVRRFGGTSGLRIFGKRNIVLSYYPIVICATASVDVTAKT